MVPARWLCLLVFIGCAALRAQGIDPGITVIPSGGGTTAAATAPVLSGISGGGTVELGQPVTLTVIFSGQVTPSDYSYQWRKGTNDISGATSNTFAISAATAADAGSYAVTVTNSAGSSVASTSLTVKALAAPVITAPPRATIASVGQGVTFGFSATGSYPRTYQWFKDGAALTGATNTTFSITAVTTADAGSYSVQVSNSQGSDTSAAASLTVNAATPPAIYSYSPNDVTVTAGGQASLTVSLSGGSGPFTFQWYKNGTAVAATTSTQLFFNAVALTDAGKYYVVVSNPAGSATSREATLTVNPPTPVGIYSQPQNQTIYQGQTLQLYVSAGGSSPITYQWLKNGTPIPGATSSSFSIQSAALSDSGSYSAVVTNPAGSVTSATATVTVNPPVAPKITTDVRDVTVVEGNSVNLSVAASGTTPFTYQWFVNGVMVSSSSSYSFNAKLSDTGSYYVVISNAAGSTKSSVANLTVTPLPPPPVVRLANRTATVGQSFSLDAYNYSYSGTTSYQWYRNGQVIPSATSSSYGVNNASTADIGDYFVVLTNSGGSTTSRTGHVDVIQGTTPPAGAWVAAQQFGNIAFFLFGNPARIERYNLATESWLPALSLPRVGTAFAVSANGIFLSAGSVIYHYALDGTGETVFFSGFTSDVGGLANCGNYLLAESGSYSSATLTSLRATDGAKMSSANYIYYWGPQMAAAPTSGKVFSRTIGISPSDIVMTTIQSTGALDQSAKDSPYHGSFPDAKRVFVSPNETYVADDSGTVYFTADLTFAGGLGGRVDDIAFTDASQLVALRGGDVIVYNDKLVDAGHVPTGIAAARIFVRAGIAYAFGYPPSGGSITVAKAVLAQAAAPAAAAPVDATTVAFTPDSVLVDRDGVVLLYSKLYRQIFRWSPATRKFLAPIQLLGWPDFIAYSSANHRVYIGYGNAQIHQVKLDAGSLTEESFGVAPQGVLGMTAAGAYLFVVDPTSPWVSDVVFASDGHITDQRAWSYYGAEYVWNPVYQRVYQFRDDTSPNDLLYTEVTTAGKLGTQKDSPYHGEIVTQYPIRVSGDGNSILLGSGKFYDANTMLANNSLANAFEDAAWVGSRVYTGRTVAAGVEVQRWGGANYALDALTVISGRLLRIFAVGTDRLLVITVRNRLVYFTLLDANLVELSTDASAPPARVSNLAMRAMAGKSDQMLIPGFVISGTQSKRVLVRAAGPALTNFGVSGVLADPQITVSDASGRAVAANDDWGSASSVTDLTAAMTKVGAFPFASGSHDAAAVLNLAPGGYTIQTQGANNGTGVALVEVYDADDAGSGGRIVNISARAQVGTGGDILIPGIVIQGITPKTLLIRAIGPGLRAFGVGGVLNDPLLKLYKGSQVVYQNDNWEQNTTATTAQIASASTKAGAFALATGSKDAMLLVTLDPGAYTAQISGADGGTGVALVEVYEVP